MIFEKLYGRPKFLIESNFFAWKCAKNAIPVHDILSQRMNIGENLCHRCHRDSETLIHAIVTCPRVKRIWFLYSLNVRTDSFRDKNIGDWLRFWLGLNLNRGNPNLSENFPLVACVIWAIWKSKNSFIYNNQTEHAQLILNSAVHMIPLGHIPPPQFPYPASHTQPTTSTSLSIWSLPRSRMFKINTDGAWDPNSLKGGMGFAFRDSNGSFHYAAALPTNVSSAEETKIQAIWTALKKAVD
ncbi:Reverse transcriptase zinc-binding domain [Macleaya cordata]|uniref:Reverse transcriptase zinc-binding domain n=1 Tax=Macleaya cordata TaxID=56857 RepID=A0A200QDD4_MACCD|nr:Reverse transcriptase zinc-binding domain [Macleaya cordata]